MFTPMANVSVAKRILIKPREKRIHDFLSQREEGGRMRWGGGTRAGRGGKRGSLRGRIPTVRQIKRKGAGPGGKGING